jgi:protein TonB
MKKGTGRLEWDHAAALLLVLALHAAVLYGLWRVRVLPQPAEALTLFVSLISPPPPRPQAAPPPAPAGSEPAAPVERKAPRPVEPPAPRLAADAPVISPTDATAALAPDPVPGSPAAGPGLLSAAPQPAGPVSLTSDLALVCPVRTPPPYPAVSRRLGETGKVVLRAELDETGRVSVARVITSSGHPRLDAAALAAVSAWRCQPAQRDGQAVRSVAVQPFDFTLEGH